MTTNANQSMLLPLTLCVRIPLNQGALDTTEILLKVALNTITHLN